MDGNREQARPDGSGRRSGRSGSALGVLAATLGYTVVLCVDERCGSAEIRGILQRLGEVVRSCPHAMLVRASCPLGPAACAGCESGPGEGSGAMLMVQRCTGETREPFGSATVLRPVRIGADLEEICTWLRRGAVPQAAPTRLDRSGPRARAVLN